ncbi:unnamed protein product [Acanthosepion pharaonis]|uniref:Uncharacterized protein n=1 Tax=Acanthosepion pharaonis TaxID=158019 RepID=A0A812BEN0_ACAPH|nr:unnamed protein product [Sepia pharaonis]
MTVCTGWSELSSHHIAFTILIILRDTHPSFFTSFFFLFFLLSLLSCFVFKRVVSRHTHGSQVLHFRISFFTLFYTQPHIIRIYHTTVHAFYTDFLSLSLSLSVSVYAFLFFTAPFFLLSSVLTLILSLFLSFFSLCLFLFLCFLSSFFLSISLFFLSLFFLSFSFFTSLFLPLPHIYSLFLFASPISCSCYYTLIRCLFSYLKTHTLLHLFLKLELDCLLSNYEFICSQS